MLYKYIMSSVVMERPKCEICGSTFATKEGVKHHQKTAKKCGKPKDENRPACEICGSTFATKEGVKHHQKTAKKCQEKIKSPVVEKVDDEKKNEAKAIKKKKVKKDDTQGLVDAMQGLNVVDDEEKKSEDDKAFLKRMPIKKAKATKKKKIPKTKKPTYTENHEDFGENTYIPDYIQEIMDKEAKMAEEADSDDSDYESDDDPTRSVLAPRKKKETKKKAKARKEKEYGYDVPYAEAEKAAKSYVSYGKGIINTVKKVIYGRKDFPPSAKKVIEANKDAKITGVSLHRRVLPKIYHSILNILSKGETEKLIKESDKDKLFHTSVWVKLDNKNTILLEKNEVLGAKLNPKEAKDEETLDITAPESLTLRELIDNTKKSMGNKFATYSAKDNNCSDFIIELLKSNNLLSTPAHDFLFQNSKKILESVPALNKIVQLATDIGGRANVLIEGGEGLNKKISKPSKMGKRMVKGSAEAKAFGAKMKALREAKKGKKPKKEIKEEMKGEGFFDDLVSKVRDTASSVASKVKDIAESGSGVGSMSAQNGGRGIAESLLNTKIATQEVKEKQGRGMKKGSAQAKAFGKRMKALREAKKMKGCGMKDEESSSDEEDEEYEDEIIKKTLEKEMKGKGLGCGMKHDASACYMLHPARQSQVTTNPNLGMGFRHHSNSHHLVQMPIQTHHIPEPPSRQPVSNIYGSGVAPRSRSYITDPTLLG